MRIIEIPKRGLLYNEALCEALERQGVDVVDGIFTGRWLWANVRPGDWLHLHWPSFHYRVRSGAPWRQAHAFLRFVAILLAARLRGARMIWTAHNLMPHDRHPVPALDVLARHFVIALSEVVLVHGANAQAALLRRFPRAAGKTRIVPQGNSIGRYPVGITRPEACRRLDIPEDGTIFLFAGLCKPYKNLELLLREYATISVRSTLVIAGAFQDEGYRRSIERLAANDSRVRIFPSYIPDDELPTYFAACDAVVLPYRDILTSGVAMLAHSFGKPVIAPRLGGLMDLVTPGTGILFEGTEPSALSGALREFARGAFDERRILEHAATFTFEDSARRTVDSLRRVTPAGRQAAADAR